MISGLTIILLRPYRQTPQSGNPIRSPVPRLYQPPFSEPLKYCEIAIGQNVAFPGDTHHPDDFSVRIAFRTNKTALCQHMQHALFLF